MESHDRLTSGVDVRKRGGINSARVLLIVILVISTIVVVWMTVRWMAIQGTKLGADGKKQFIGTSPIYMLSRNPMYKAE